MRSACLYISILFYVAVHSLAAQHEHTFRVDVNELIQANVFHPEANDVVVVRGAFNNWSGNAFELFDTTRSGVYSNTFALPDEENKEFKYLIVKSSGQVLWEYNPNNNNPPYGNRFFDTLQTETDTFRLNTYHYGLGGHEVLFSAKQLQNDFTQFRDSLKRNHCCLYEFTSKDLFDSLFEAQYAKISDSLTPVQFFNILTPITAKIGCGHTAVWMPTEFWDVGQQHLFPIKLRYIEGRWLSGGSYYPTDLIPRGSAIVRINGELVDSITQKMLRNYSADAMNPFFRMTQVERRFSMLYARSHGFYTGFDIEYSLPYDTVIKTSRLLPASNSAVRAFVFSNFTTPPLGFEVLNNHTAKLTIPTFSYYEKVGYFTGFIDSCFSVLAKEGIENLILDLRGNDGGDPFCAAPLFSYLQKKPSPYFAEEYGHYAPLAKQQPMPEFAFKGNLYVLVDGRCFSTNGHFTALLKYHELGTFVGSETGATYWCNAGKDGVLTLRNTHIQLYFARSKFRAAVEGMAVKDPIIPDIRVVTKLDQFVNDEDAVLEKTLERIGE